MDDDYIDEDLDSTDPNPRRPFYIDGRRPIDKLPSVGQQMKDAWDAAHPDEPYPT